MEVARTNDVNNYDLKYIQNVQVPQTMLENIKINK